MLLLQRRIGNRAVGRLLDARSAPRAVQRLREDGEAESVYVLDEFGRPGGARSVVGRVQGVRNEEAQGYVSRRINLLLDNIFAGSGKQGYHAGHLITRRLGGSGDARNLVPVPASYNTDIGQKKTGKKVDEEGRPVHWEEGDERFSDFEKRVDGLVGQGIPAPLTVTVEVAYGPEDEGTFLARLLDRDSLALPDLTPEGVDAQVWRYAMRALLRHVHRTLRTIPFGIRATLSQGSSRLSVHEAGADQLLQLDRPWTVARGLLAALAKDLSGPVGGPHVVDGILAARCGYTGPFSDLPAYFDAASDRMAQFSGRRDYDAAVQEMAAQAPPTGILKTYDNGGVAGGVDAFIWMDPKGTARVRYGGGAPAISPKGVTWGILDAARPGRVLVSDRKKMYVRAHLLNAQLHGPGNDPENLVPFCDAANSRMEKGFEAVVKRHPALYAQFAGERPFEVDEEGPFVTEWLGVWWQTRATEKVQRPDGYPPLEVAEAMPAHPAVVLALEEAKMPRSIEMKAYAARYVRKSRAGPWEMQLGGLIVSHRERNSLDGSPVLGETNTGVGLEVPAIGMAVGMARRRTFANSAPEVLRLAAELLGKAGYALVASGNRIAATPPHGGSPFNLTVTPRGQRMADVDISSAKGDKGSQDARLDALGAEVRLLDVLEASIPAVDTGALAAAPTDPAELADLRLAYARRLAASLGAAIGKAAIADPSWPKKAGAGLAADLDRAEMFMDLAELDGPAEESMKMLDETVVPALEVLRTRVAKALAGTGVTLDDQASRSGSQESWRSFPGSGPSGPPEGSIPAGNGYWVTPGQQGRLRALNRVNMTISPDGDCLFASLIAMGAFPGTVKQFREHVADRVADERINVRPFMLDPATTAREIATPGSYNNLSGDSTPSILARALGVNLCILNENGTVTPVDAGSRVTYTLLRFLSPGAHYHATAPSGH